MRKYIIVFLSSIFITLSSYAKHVPEERATQVAQVFFKTLTKSQNVVISDVFIESMENINTYYVFSFAPKGFVIVSADDNVSPILAYSVTGLFNKINIPTNVRGWLDQYSKGIYDVIESNQNNVSNDWEKLLSGEFQSVKSLVTPLCTTLWDQSCYYNELCPTDGLGPCGHAVTGCVATAIAQVMKYWNYPTHGQGIHSYNSQWYGNLTADFGSTTYNWGNMPDVVTSSNSDVATLMYQAGVSVDMGYYATSSGSNLYFARTAMPQYFKYSNNIEFVYKLNYSDSTWLVLMKNELDAGRPVLYQGRPDSTWMDGHAWVCDGYDNSNFLHFNWGWGPGYEGFYQLGNFIYHNYNEAVIKIMPVVNCDIALRNFISPVSSTFTTPSTIKVKISNFDTLPHVNFPIKYQVDGGSMVSEIISSTLLPLTDTIYEFIQPFDFSPNPGHVYNVKIYSDLACDGYRFNDTLNIQIENVACVNPPYTMGFEPSENMNGWLINDVDGDGNKWNIGLGGNTQPTCVYYNGGTSQGNDWLFSKCQQLEVNKVYKLSYYYNGMGQFFPNKLSVYLGNQQNIAAMTTLLTDDTNIVNTTYQKKEVYFTVSASGSYYFGWYCHSDPDNYSFVLDDINITEQTATDIGVISTNLSSESCDLQQENIKVVVRNFCSTVLNNIPISYSINGGTPVNEVISTPIAVGDTFTYIFTSPADFSAGGLFQVKIFTSLPNDTLFNNDTLIVNLSNHVSIVPYYTMGFELTDDFSGWKIFNNNSDVYTWSIQNTGGRTQPKCIRYDYSSWLPADDWFVSSCISLTALQTYKLGFWYKIESSQWPEKLKVFIGNGQDYTAQTTQLLDFPELMNESYQNAEVLFTVPSDGLYYIGWYCYSNAVMFNLYVDDIYLDMTTDRVENNFTEEFFVFPNPCKNELSIVNSNKENEQIKYELTTVSGKQIKEISTHKSSIKMSTDDLSKGIYILKITSSKGVTVKKIIKQ